MGTKEGDVHSGKVDESSFYISPDKLNADSISDIKTFKPSYHLSFHRRAGETDPGSFSEAPPSFLKHHLPFLDCFGLPGFHLLLL